MPTADEIIEKAQQFIYRNGRLLERRWMEHLFKGGSKVAVIDALRAYQNEDGGFGHALEPDIRDPHSQPVPTETALHIMDGLGLFDSSIISGILRYLEGITQPGGGFPRALRSVNHYPHAPWWTTERDDSASMNPTGNIVALLLKQQSVPLAQSADEGRCPQWLADTINFIWRNIGNIGRTDYHDLIQAVNFLEQASDRPRAEALQAQVDSWLLAPGVIEYNSNAEGYVHKVLDWAPVRSSYCYKLINSTDQEAIPRHLEALIAEQEEDGGWPISWEPPSQAALLEWRSYVTVQRLLTLQSYGRLTTG